MKKGCVFGYKSFLHFLFFLIFITDVYASEGISGTNQTNFYANQLYSQSGLKEKDKIIELSGQPNKVNFDQYGGYVTVNKEAGRSLFYYFVEADGINKDSAPLIIWFNGGPGCSSLIGAMGELGPFRVRSDGKSLAQNPYAWNKVANVLFLESPAGVGFSYSNRTHDYETTGDQSTSQDAYIFILNWLERFPEYKNRDLYLCGESYAGHYVPQLAMVINRHKNNNTFVNLKGIAIGNPVIDDEVIRGHGLVNFIWMRGLMPDESYQEILEICDFKSGSISNECNDAIGSEDMRMMTIRGTEQNNVYDRLCKTENITQTPMETSIEFPDPCYITYLNYYMNLPEVRRALHATASDSTLKWDFCADRYAGDGIWLDRPITILPVLKSLLRTGTRILVYSGDFDYKVPYTITLEAINKLNLKQTTPWTLWSANKETGGFFIVYENDLTFATVRAAGHEVPLSQPEKALVMIGAFLKNESLPVPNFRDFGMGTVN